MSSALWRRYDLHPRVYHLQAVLASGRSCNGVKCELPPTVHYLKYIPRVAVQTAAGEPRFCGNTCSPGIDDPVPTTEPRGMTQRDGCNVSFPLVQPSPRPHPLNAKGPLAPTKPRGRALLCTCVANLSVLSRQEALVSLTPWRRGTCRRSCRTRGPA